MDQSQYFVSLKKTHLKLTIFDLMIAIKCYLELDMYTWCNTVTKPEYVFWHIGFTDSLISIESSHEPIRKTQFFPSRRSFYGTDEEKTQDFEMEHTSPHHHRAKLISTRLLYSNSHSEVTLRFAAQKSLIVTLTTPNPRSNLKIFIFGAYADDVLTNNLKLSLL